MADLPFPGSRLVVAASAVARAWDALATRIQPHIDSRPCLLLGVLFGGAVPLVKISERLRGDFLMDYCHLSRYRGSTSGGEPSWVARPRLGMRGLTVILVDDIYDEGRTLSELQHYCMGAGAARVLTAVLVRKRHSRHVTGVAPDFVGLEVGDDYVFGCGMDYRERWRHLDAIYAIASDGPPGREPKA
jgi:hypoxanthine phosphoribosyltransferase